MAVRGARARSSHRSPGAMPTMLTGLDLRGRFNRPCSRPKPGPVLGASTLKPNPSGDDTSLCLPSMPPCRAERASPPLASESIARSWQREAPCNLDRLIEQGAVPAVELVLLALGDLVVVSRCKVPILQCSRCRLNQIIHSYSITVQFRC